MSGIALNCEVSDYLWPWTTSTPVFMIHGFARNAAVWTRWLPRLCENHRVYRVTLPGMGGTQIPPPGFVWSVAALRQAFTELLDHFELERVHFVGESAGGMLGALFAAEFPERVASLIAVETPLRRGTALRKEHNLGHSSFAGTMEQYGMEEYCRRTIDARLDTNKASIELIEWYIAQIAKTPDEVGISFKAFVDTLDLEPSLNLLRIPVLLLCGDKSRVITPDQVDILRRNLPNIDIRIFDGYGHGINVLEPERCALAATDFWAAHCNNMEDR